MEIADREEDNKARLEHVAKYNKDWCQTLMDPCFKYVVLYGYIATVTKTQVRYMCDPVLLRLAMQ